VEPAAKLFEVLPLLLLLLPPQAAAPSASAAIAATAAMREIRTILSFLQQRTPNRDML
jgi:hypothetical protein